MKKTYFLIAGLLFAIRLLAQNPAGSPVATHGLLKVKDNRVVGNDNNVVSIGGNSLFWSQWGGEFYNSNTVKWLKKDWNSKIIRAAMGVDEADGYLAHPATEKQKVFDVVDACIAEGLYVIIDWHSHHAENYKTESIAFFKEMAAKYGSYPNVIYEIYNEPLDVASWSKTIKPYAVDVIAEIRKIDPDNLILVGTRTWSQEVVEAAKDRIIDNNVAYVLHFYVGAHGQYLRDLAKQALDMGLPLFVSEWGVWGSDADLENWMIFLRDNQLNWCNWAVITKDEPSSVLKASATGEGNWSFSDLTTIGRKVKNYMQNWPEWKPFVDDPCTLSVKPYNTLIVPGTIEAEYYDEGCDGDSYHDTEAANQGGKLRTDGVDIEACEDDGGGYNLGYLEKDEWIQYTFYILESGVYNGTVRIASKNGGGSFKLQINGNDVTEEITVPATGDWQEWTDLPLGRISMTKQDNARLRLVVSGSGFNLNKISFTDTVTGTEDGAESEAVKLYPTISQTSFTIESSKTIINLSVYHITGAMVSDKKTPVTHTSFGQDLSAGAYLVVVQLDDGSFVRKYIQKQ
jgi:endoglucanase